MSADEPTLEGRIARGAGWIVAGRFTMRAFGLLNTLVVARILAPEDFGLLAVAFTAVQLLQGLSDFGVAQAVVRFRDAGKDEYDTMFTLSVIRGVMVAVFLALAAWPAAIVLEDTRYTALLLVVTLLPLMESLVNPRFFEFERQLDFRREFVMLACNKLLSVIVSVALALIYKTYWALVAGIMVGTAAQLFLSYWFIHYRPVLSLKEWRKVLDFSGWVAAAGALVTVNLKLDSLILAKIFGKAPTGGYYVGLQLAQLPTNEIAIPVARAIYPGLSELQDNEHAMRWACLGSAEAMAAIVAPIAFGMAFIAEDFVPLLLGPGWDFAIPVVQWVTPAMGLYFITMPIQPYVIAKGRTKLLFYRELFYFIVRVPLFILAAVMFGFMGAVLARSLAGIVQMGLNLELYRRVSGDAMFAPIRRAWRSLLALAVMSIWFVVMKPMLHEEQLPLFARLALDVGIGAVLYLITHALAWIAAGRPAGVESLLLDKVRPFLTRAAA